ncbi:DUF3326 domain-containing protein [Burkholderia thailandensis]|uniref:DUF3326 domain-containing protein n=1 Tax=Burkholderia thailandensis (strain ATCC 700388 / DSM 13276 / CCUG 48851 / CIP 106301 / E264) TaxID=271848 RepID=Q2T5P1_BURTA|nr:DUF3326 domain-containing protein [Burkholderia thailandensis]ABC34446.1 conserved hypothetical protein [Burkholderia thailandensis E264]AHI76285.1 hypothetical protein BTQ_4596 [Burkholderia thailandensis 2002721723]AHI81783.1 hypothetical protein BTJ_5579 [Burkholderia thailandensis E444]AIC90729.1 hypothetical protein BTRA_4320 [Burkholderia thailandensis USAMRU Malaysia \
MQVRELSIEIPVPAASERPLSHVERAVMRQVGASSLPVRFVVASSDATTWRCEVGVIEDAPAGVATNSAFGFVEREIGETDAFNVAMIVPTGIGCAIGGHAGDAAPAVALLASVCDTLLTHPNAVNASDLNEMPGNALYLEGSTLTRLLMGTIGLRRVRANRVLAIVEAHDDAPILHAAINSVAAAGATCGIQCPGVVLTDPDVQVASHFMPSGRATGTVRHLDRLLDAIAARRGEFDAIALSSRVAVEAERRIAYFRSHGELVNPWGGAEALLTHALSLLLNVPAAHAPMSDSAAVAHEDIGIVDPRMAAEAISTGFFMCVLKGLKQSPRIVASAAAMRASGTLTAADVSCVITPDGCIGLPVLAALEQRMPVIAVRGNANVMRNRLADLPWAPGQLHEVDNYLEAAGLVAALRRGIWPGALRRPIAGVAVQPFVRAAQAKARERRAEPAYLPEL